jgi:hypothetical protein
MGDAGLPRAPRLAFFFFFFSSFFASAEAAEAEADGDSRRDDRERFPRATAGQARSRSSTSSPPPPPQPLFSCPPSQAAGSCLRHGGVQPARSAPRREQMMSAAVATTAQASPSTAAVMASFWRCCGRLLPLCEVNHRRTEDHAEWRRAERERERERGCGWEAGGCE